MTNANALGRPRRLSHDAVLQYAQSHPTVPQADIAAHFGTTQSRVSAILRAAGVSSVARGRPLKRKPGQSDLEYAWEQILHDHGLGMKRGMRLNNQRLLYGYDPRKEDLSDKSATSICS